MKDLKVLVVEDDTVTAADIQHRLERFGCAVMETAETGESAIELAEREKPHLVIMDITLSGRLNGIDAAANIRLNLNIPVIFLTGDSDENTVLRATAVEPFGYILKPVESRSLYVAIRMAVARHELEKKIKETKEALHRSEERHRILVESSRDGIVVILNGDIIFSNRAAGTILGLDEEHGPVGRKVEDFMPANICDVFYRHLKETVLEEKELPVMEWPYSLPDGSIRNLEAASNVINHDKGKAILSHIRDVTERKLADKALLENQRRLDMVLKGGSLGFWDWDLETGHVIFNRRWSKMLGYRHEDLVPEISAWTDRIHPDDHDTVMNSLADHLKEVSSFFQGEYRIRSKSGQWKWLLSNGLVMERHDRGPLRLAMVSIDITDRKGAEEEINRLNSELERRVESRTSELESANKELKEFAYVVSHDLKAPLRGISQLVNWLKKDYRDVINEEGQEHMELIANRVKRMDQLIDGILEYSRVGRIINRKEIVDCNELVNEVTEMIMPPENIGIVMENKLPSIDVERIRLEQVFQNLIGNAVQYMTEGGGRVSVSSKDSGGLWQFCVSDDGPGIDPRYHEKIFKIFQTLKARDDSESTGIGLTLVKKIVETFGGEIWLESEVGHGSSFFFTIPKNETVYRKQETGSGSGR